MMKRLSCSLRRTDNKTSHYFLCAVLCLALAFSGKAQTPHWILSTNYQSIRPFSKELFKVKENGLVGIVDNTGTIVVPVTADSITNFTNGYALVLKKEDGGYRVQSILDFQRKIKPVDQSEPLFVGPFPFFSEKKCVVSNKKGKFGYMDISGRLVIPCKYLSARPFNEGLASVCKGKGGLKGLVNSVVDMVGGNADAIGQSLYIDDKGQQLKLANEIGTPKLASTFSGGKAFVMNDKGAYIIDKSGQIVSIERGEHLVFDDYFILTSMAEPRLANEPYLVTRENDEYDVYQRNGLKGLMRNGIVVLPAQFDEVDYLWQGIAVVKHKSKYGVVGMSGSMLNCNVDEKNGMLTASATLPGDFDGKALSVARMSGGQSMSYVMAGDEATRTLEVKLPEENARQDGEVTYELRLDDLVLWRSSEAFDADEQDANAKARSKTKKNSKDNKATAKGGILVSCPSSVKANAKNICQVPVTVTNKSNVALNVKVTSSAGGSVTVVVPAGKSKTATLSIPDVKKSKKCTITASSSAGSKSCKAVLNPYFNL